MATFNYTTTSVGGTVSLSSIVWDNYTATINGNNVVWTNSGSLGPARIELTYSGLTTTAGEDGQPTTIYTGGTLTGMRIFNLGDQQNPSVAITNLKVSAVYFNALREADLNNQIAQLLTSAAGNTINGTANADTVFSYSGADKVFAGDGADMIYDIGGKDTYDGGAGTDTVSYEMHWFNPSATATGINVNLSSMTVGSGGSTDKLIGIERVIGSHLNDTFQGTSGNDLFTGMGGSDTFRGGAGIDTLDYSRDDDLQYGGFRGITADLTKTIGTIRDGFGGRDNATGIENIIGTDRRDSITGSNSANELVGAGGDDIINGRAGNDALNGGNGVDTINGGDGNDQLTGGDGADIFVFTDTRATTGLNIGTDTITDFVNGTDRIDLRGLADAFSDITATQSGSNTVLAIAGVTGSITLNGFTATNVDATDFILG